ncbi:hypothetical protein B5S29_g3131 [[Candida] boidinii]|nr:hypothetical protein B5S29_g3131 [[Candida] boidinii]
MDLINSIVSLQKRSCKEKNKELCETSSVTTPLTIGLAVAIPVAAVILVVCFFLYKSYRRNKKESLDDDDPDFNGDNTVLPDYPSKEEYYKSGSIAGDDNPFENKYSVRYPKGIIPPNQQQYQQQYQQQGYPYSIHNNPSNVSIPTSNMYGGGYNNNRTQSFILPYAQETNSKNSLNELARALGSEYEGYRVASPALRNPNSGLNSRRTSFSNQSGIMNSGNNNNYERSLRSTEDTSYNSVNPNNGTGAGTTGNKNGSPIKYINRDTNSPSSDVDEENDDRVTKVANPKPVPSTSNHFVIDDDEDEDEDEDDAETNEHDDEVERNFDAINNNNDISHSRTPSSTFHSERINDRDDLYPQSNKTNAIDERIVDTTAANNNGTAPLNPHQDIPDLAEALDDEVLPLSPEEEEQINRMKSVYKVYFSRENSMKSIKSKGEQQQQQFDSSNLPALPLHQLDNTNPANISNNNDNEMANGGISSVAPPQISVSHDDDDDNEENQDPMINNTAKNMSNNNGQHELRVNTDLLNTQEPRASYASSIYTSVQEGGAPNSGNQHPYYPHEQIQNMLANQNEQDRNNENYQNGYYYDNNGQYYEMTPEQQQQYYQYQQQYPNQLYPQQYPNQQYPNQQYPQQYQRMPQGNKRDSDLPVFMTKPGRGKGKKLENLPLPHQLANRNSVLETFTDFERNRKYSEKIHSSPYLNNKNLQAFNPIDHNEVFNSSEATGNNTPFTQENPANTNAPLPHHMRDSIVMLNPVEIGKAKTYKPAGSFVAATEQARKGSTSSPSIAGAPTFGDSVASLTSPTTPVMPFGITDGFNNPHSAENLIPHSGSQADLRRYMGNANV